VLDQRDPYRHVISNPKKSHTTPAVNVPHLDIGRRLQHHNNETHLILDLPSLQAHPTKHLSGFSSLRPQMIGEMASREVNHPPRQAIPLVVVDF
jgi:hypothetical protein